MARRRLSTSDYDQVARTALGGAVFAAREAAGYRSRSALATAAGVSLRSIDKLELGEPGVGQRILLAVARILPNWDETTPQRILDEPATSVAAVEPKAHETTPTPRSPAGTTRATPKGGEPAGSRAMTPAQMYAALEQAGWTIEQEEEFQLLKRRLAANGLELTPSIYLTMRRLYEGDQRETQTTPTDDGQ